MYQIRSLTFLEKHFTFHVMNPWFSRMEKHPDFTTFLPPALNRAKAQHACVLRPPERGGAGCQLKNAHDRHTAIHLG